MRVATIRGSEAVERRCTALEAKRAVGARRTEHKATLGRTIAALGGDPYDPEVAALIQAIAQEVLGRDGPDPPPSQPGEGAPVPAIDSVG